jgi:predicted metal-dependent hydrolase
VRNDSSQHAISFGQNRIAFVLMLGDHDRFQITVQPDMTVEVHAPEGKPLETILARVQRRAAWITKQLRYFEQFQPRPVVKQFVSGETFRYLGRQYRLKVISSKERRVHLSRPFLMVYLPDPKDARAVESLLREWYHERARVVFASRLDALYEKAKRHFPCKPTLRVQRMVRRWGSCTRQNVIVLNTVLVQVPVRCIDYVLVHELCHLRVHHHGSQFFRLLGRLLPDWEPIKARLESASVAWV